MTTEEKRAFEKSVWNKYKIKMTFSDKEQPFNEKVNKYFDDKLAKANDTLSKVRIPKGLFEQFGLPHPKFGQEIETTTI